MKREKRGLFVETAHDASERISEDAEQVTLSLFRTTLDQARKKHLGLFLNDYG